MNPDRRARFAGDVEIELEELRDLEFNPDQPRDEQGRWTEGFSLTDVEARVRDDEWLQLSAILAAQNLDDDKTIHDVTDALRRLRSHPEETVLDEIRSVSQIAKKWKLSLTEYRGIVIRAAAGFDDDQPRDDHGRWTDDGGAEFTEPSDKFVEGMKRHREEQELLRRMNETNLTRNAKGDVKAELDKQTELAQRHELGSVARPVHLLGEPPGLDQRDAVRYVSAYGAEHTFAKTPDDVEMGEPNECYRNASLLVVMRPDLTYAEGYMYPTKQNLPVLHAWAVTKDGTVVDPTPVRGFTGGIYKPGEGPRSAPPRYFGITYDRGKYLTYLYKAKLYGVLGSTKKNAERAITTGGRNLR